MTLLAGSVDDRFEPFSAAYLADPYPALKHLRETAPAFYDADLDHWIVTRYADVREIFTTPARFSAANALDPLTPPCPQARAALAAGGYDATSVLTNVDPPLHTRHRRLANVAFTPKRIAALEPFVRNAAARFCEEREELGYADMVGDLAWALPALVLFQILGLPESDLARVKDGARNRGAMLFGRASVDEQVDAAGELASFWRYAERLIEAREERPGEDFISQLMTAPGADGTGDAFTRQELTSLMLIMLFAGHETTTNLLGNSFRRLLERRDSWEAICADPSLIPGAIEEVLRYDSSVITWRHKTREAVEIGGVPVPADAKLLLLIGAANRDPATFPDPERFDIRRANAREHLAFGCGIHTCLGAPLARFEARLVLEEVSRRLPSLQLDADASLTFAASISHRGPDALPVTWTALVADSDVSPR